MQSTELPQGTETQAHVPWTNFTWVFGDHRVKLASADCLVISRTCFQHPRRSLATWFSSDGCKRNQIEPHDGTWDEKGWGKNEKRERIEGTDEGAIKGLKGLLEGFSKETDGLAACGDTATLPDAEKCKPHARRKRRGVIWTSWRVAPDKARRLYRWEEDF